MRPILTTILLLIVLAFSGTTGASGAPQQMSAPAMKDINAVKEAHAAELMAIKGVVGVYVGTMNKDVPCICIMVDRLTHRLRKKLPRVLETYPVRVEVTGKIVPLKKK